MTPWAAACQASLFITNSRSLLKLMSIELVMPSNHLFLCHPLLLLPSIFPSIRLFSNESVLRIRWPKYWSFSFSINPFNIQDWFPLGWTGWISLQSKRLSRVLSNTTVRKHQFSSSQLSLWSQLSHPYMTTEKTIALTRQTFVSKVMSLLFNSAILLNYYYSIQTFIYYISIYRIFCLSVFSKMLFFLFSH